MPAGLDLEERPGLQMVGLSMHWIKTWRIRSLALLFISSKSTLELIKRRFTKKFGFPFRLPGIFLDGNLLLLKKSIPNNATGNDSKV